MLLAGCTYIGTPLRKGIMDYTREDVIEKIKDSFEKQCKENNTNEVLVNQVVFHAGFKKDEKDGILKMFCVEKYADLITRNTDLEAYMPEGGRNYVVRRKTKNSSAPPNTLPSNSNKDIQAEQLPSSCPINKRIAKLLEALNDGLYEKKEAVRLALLSAIAGEPIFFIGPPGCAKSKIARKLSHVFKKDENTTFFEYLMQAFSSPDEIFGPVLLSELEQGNFKRNTLGYLPTANVAFLDEIWKASPPILNTLLTIINERKFHNGKDVESVPLKALLAASNETPEAEAGLEAIYDRFIVRVQVAFIKNEKNFFEMIQAPSNVSEALDEDASQYCIAVEEVDEWQKQIDEIEVSNACLNVIKGIKDTIQKKAEDEQDASLIISDRRWKNIVHLMKTSAFLNGRDETDLMDCQLISYCIWDGISEFGDCEDLVEQMVGAEGLEFNTNIGDIQDEIKDFREKISTYWYNKEVIQPKPSKPAIYTNNDTQYYKVKDSNGNSYYFETDFEDENYPYYYNMSFNYVRQVQNAQFSPDKKKINFQYNYSNYSFDVEWTQEVKASSKLLKKADLFEDDKYEPLFVNFEKNHFEPIQQRIKTELEKIEEYIKNEEEPFKSNLFAKQSMNSIIFAKVASAKKELEDAKVELEKERTRYKK